MEHKSAVLPLAARLQNVMPGADLIVPPALLSEK